MKCIYSHLSDGQEMSCIYKYCGTNYVSSSKKAYFSHIRKIGHKIDISPDYLVSITRSLENELDEINPILDDQNE
jgi:hypothetical protein